MRFAAILAALLLVLLPVPAAVARQSEADLRAENEALRTRVQDLELELAAARARIAELERRNGELQSKANAGGVIPVGTGAVPPPAEVTTTIDESVPTASPHTLLRALQSDYGQALGEAGGYSTPRERTLYFRALEKWVHQTNRRYRAPIEWNVRVDRIGETLEKSTIVRVTAIDPGNGIDLGDPFEIAVPHTQVKRLSKALEPGAHLRLRGTIVPKVIVNERREAAGAFDSPRFIGPFSEFGFQVEVVSVSHVLHASAEAPSNGVPPAVDKPTAPVPPKSPIAPKKP